MTSPRGISFKIYNKQLSNGPLAVLRFVFASYSPAVAGRLGSTRFFPLKC